MIDLYFMVVSSKSVYNFILGKPFAATLDIMASPVHLKMKNHNLHDEHATICFDLSEENKYTRLYNATRTWYQFEGRNEVLWKSTLPTSTST